jgi:hypothetical protein
MCTGNLTLAALFAGLDKYAQYEITPVDFKLVTQYEETEVCGDPPF